MHSSLFLARIIGPLLMIVAVGILLNVKTYQQMGEEFYRGFALRYLGGFLALLFGLLIVEFHNVWEVRWTVIITVIGYIGVLKGALLLVAPGLVSKLSDVYTKNPKLLIVNSIIVLVVGLVLTVKGFWG